ncbi:uncharacterized protein [Channa argus]|uniref:uncharacterized protein n=1 Tax=Channa argus TaxID=215402 RepID=UPI00351FA47B
MGCPVFNSPSSGGEGRTLAGCQYSRRTLSAVTPTVGALPSVDATVCVGQVGYSLQFATPPPSFAGILETRLSSPAHTTALASELSDLLGKRAISVVPPMEENQGFYSRYFLVPKKSGEMRPILDLSFLNQFMVVRRFHMLTTASVLRSLRPGDWLSSVDLKDAYFHIPVAMQHRKFLRFSFLGVRYQYNCLPFGYSLAPRTFSKCLETALAPLRAAGMRVLFYLDDLLLLAPSREQALLQMVDLVTHLSSLGFTINWRKSSPFPAQSIIFLGVELDVPIMRARLSQERRETLLAMLHRLTPRRVVTVHSVMRLLGMMAAALSVVPLGLLHMRRLQRWFSRLQLDPVRHRRRLVMIPPSVGPDLAYWRGPRVMLDGVPLGRPSSHVSVFTDASLLGWGGTCLSQSVGAPWPEGMSLHINALELLSVWNVLQHFAPVLLDCHVLVHTDNTTTASYINRQGGVRSSRLLSIARRLLLWAHSHLRSIRAVYIPGVLNTAADTMSRGGPRPGEWVLHTELVQEVWSRFGRAEVDLFAAKVNAQCPLWFSLRARDSPPLGVDAFSHRPWPRRLLYAFPPVPLIPRLLDRVREEYLTVILVAPRRVGAPWFPSLCQMLAGPPWELPWRSDALSQANGMIRSPPVLLQRLWVWPLRGSA